jgi:hypothetical protein
MKKSDDGSPGAFAAALSVQGVAGMAALRSNSHAAVVCGYIVLFSSALMLVSVLLRRRRKPRT